jgi:hypothetical protein
MIWAALSLDDSNVKPFPFVKHPKVGDRIGVTRCGAHAHATIVGMRHERGSDGEGTLFVSARSAA